MATRSTHPCTRFAALLVVFLAGAVSILAACSNDVTRRDVAASLSELVIVPRYQAAAVSAEAMNDRIRVLVSDPTAARLEAARDGWREVRLNWSRIQAYTFGPVMERRLASQVEWWPIDEEKILATLTRTSISAEDVRETFAADQRGFSALEYLLFAESEVVLERLRSGDEAYGQYLTALATVIADALRLAADDWSDDYVAVFSGTGDRAISDSLAIADLVRVPVFLTETVGDMQLGIALGVTKPEADLSVIPEGSAGAGVAEMEQTVRGIQDTYIGGADGLGVSDLVAQLSEEADQRMRDALSDAIAAMESLGGGGQSLIELLETDPDAVAAARDAIKAVQIVLTTEVVSLLGVTIGFSDNDGDS